MGENPSSSMLRPELDVDYHLTRRQHRRLAQQLICQLAHESTLNSIRDILGRSARWQRWQLKFKRMRTRVGEKRRQHTTPPRLQ